MKKLSKFLSIFMLLALVASAVYAAFGDVTPAYAHSTTVKVVATCNKDTGQYDVKFSISSDFNLSATVTSMNPVLPGMPTSIPPKGTVSTTMSLPGNSSGNVTFSATIKWSDGFTDSDSGSDHLNGNCVMNTLTPTKTLTPTMTSTLLPSATLTVTSSPTATLERKILWCHVEPNGNSQTLNLPAAALQNAGHMDANGNPLHAGDHPGECISPTATSTATLVPTETLTATTEPATATSTVAPTETVASTVTKAPETATTEATATNPPATSTVAPTETVASTVTKAPETATTEATATTDPGTPVVEATVTTDPGTPVVLGTATNAPKGPGEWCTKLLEGRPDQPRWQDNERCVEYFKNAGGSNWFDKFLIWLFG